MATPFEKNHRDQTFRPGPTDAETLFPSNAGQDSEGEHALRSNAAWESAYKTRAGIFRSHQPGPASRIGPYTIIKLIGEGGMGRVYQAKQDHPKRLVALKLIGRGQLDREFLSRFESEYQTLAWMNHHHIARLYEAGTTVNGDAYFTMEYVEGVPLIQFCRQHALKLKARLQLFLGVCEGVRHAHQKAIVHRDLKPSNILVTLDGGRPMVKIIDFGIAKDLKPLSVRKMVSTQAGKIVGTPAYMSPEQLVCDGEIDTRSDVYSLGVILYELITGLHPLDKDLFRGKAWDQVLRICREEEPPRPGERLRKSGFKPFGQDGKGDLKAIRGDLDWVVVKAMEKNRDRRYQWVDQLKNDVVNVLEKEAISARPPNIFYRIGKFYGRNRPGLIWALLIFAGVLTSVLTLGISIEKLQHAQRLNLAVAENALEAQRLSSAQLEEKRQFLNIIEALILSHPEGASTDDFEQILPSMERRLGSSKNHQALKMRLNILIAEAWIKSGRPVKASRQLDKALFLEPVVLCWPETLNSLRRMEKLVHPQQKERIARLIRLCEACVEESQADGAATAPHL